IDKVENTNTLPLGDKQEIVSDVFELTEDTPGNFKQDITLTLNFDNNQFNEETFDIAIYWLNEQTGEWEELNGIDINWGEGTVSGAVDYFTKFAVIATEKAPADP